MTAGKRQSDMFASDLEEAVGRHAAAPARPFLGVEKSITGRRWIDRLDARGSALALDIAQRNDMPDLLAGDGRWDHVANGPLRPLDQAPTLVSADPAQIADSVEPIAGKTLTFRFADVVRPVEFRDLELVPFFTVHDSRYVLYWRNVTAQRYDKILSDLKQQERQRLALDTQTIDRVAPGQQQPEADHGFQGERTSTGMWQDRSFRHADGWFSYQLQTKKRRDIQLMVTYFGSDRRKFDILLNDRLLKSVELDAPLPGKFIDVRYDIPDEALGELTNGILTVKFAAHEGSMAGGIFDVRLLAR
ncbi:MAG: hypothetical protein KC438_13535 [Thermomicrobiales bacterium]|nr:hypothetical protein [Thermomicrobiales bacterium]